MRKKLAIVLIIVLLFLACLADLWASKYALTVSTYSVCADGLTHPVRIVQLTDLHDSVFGNENRKLIQKVQDAAPDLIFLTGDFVNSKKDTDVSRAEALIRNLAKIAPVYFSYGNQEKALESKTGICVAELCEAAGAKVLDFSYEDTIVNGQALRIGGIFGYCVNERYAKETKRENEAEFLKEFQDTSDYSILLCHMPLCWLESGSLYDWDVDCVFSGHIHGGQVRIPFVGGLWAPDQGWFPGEVCGVYETTEDGWQDYVKKLTDWSEQSNIDYSLHLSRPYRKSTLVLSRGLGSTEWMPRFHNIPEIVIVDFLPGGED